MDKKEIGLLIARLRKEKNMTQKDLANILGVTNRAVSKWETGEGYPDITLFPIIAEVFEVTTDELLTGRINIDESKSSNRTNLEEYFYHNSVSRCRNQYLIAIMIMLIGVIASFFILKQYIGLYTTIIYAELVTLITLVISCRYFYNAHQSLNEIKAKYDMKLEGNKKNLFDYILFYACFLISFIMAALIIPTHQFLCYGYRAVNGKVIGEFTFPEGKLAIDFGFAVIGYVTIYLILFIIGSLIIKKKYYNRVVKDKK